MVLEKFRKGVSLSCLPSSLTTVFGYPSKAEIDHGALIVLAVVVDYTLATNENCEKVSTKISHLVEYWDNNFCQRGGAGLLLLEMLHD